MDKIIQLRSLLIFSKDLTFNIKNLQYKNLSSGKGQKTEVSLRPQACNFIKKETLAQVFSCEFFEISKSTSGGCFCSSFCVGFLTSLHDISKNFVLVLTLFCVTAERSLAKLLIFNCFPQFIFVFINDLSKKLLTNNFFH